MTDTLLERRFRVLGKGAPLFYDEPLHLVRGEGVWLYDAHGRRYLDAYNNVPVVGHCNPRVVEAIARQSSLLNVHTRYLHERIVEYAERLTSTFVAQDMAIFTCTGSEANDLALRMARKFTGREGIICSNNTYHGNTAAVDELSTTFTQGRTGSARVLSVPYPDTYRPLLGLQGAALEDAYVDAVRTRVREFQRNGLGLAGMLVCPVFANEGLPDSPPGYLRRAAEVVREAGGLVIFDEVQSGFGRTGSLWAHPATGVIPDIVTLGKPMGNGYPIAGVVSRAEIVNDFRNQVMYFNTFAGNPVACAAAMGVLDAIEADDLLARVREVGSTVTTAMRALATGHPTIGDVREKGAFWAIELVVESSKTPDPGLARSVVNRMLSQGVLISRLGQHGNVLKIRPPLVFEASHAELLIQALDDGLTRARDD